METERIVEEFVANHTAVPRNVVKIAVAVSLFVNADKKCE